MVLFKLTWKLLKFLAILLLIISIGIAIFITFAPVFGGKPDSESLKRITLSKNFNGQKFINNIATTASTPDPNNPISISDFFTPAVDKNPSQPLPSKSFDKTNFKNGEFVWFGHSTVLLKANDVTILTDPVFNSAAPVQFLITPFTMQVKHNVSDLPTIDVVLISHDHYDHLDYLAIQELDTKVKKFYVPLGIKAHLQRWNIASEKIVELDWYQSNDYQGIKLTLTPSRHFSGRAIARNRTLWGSWVIQSSSLNIFFSGDSGYFDEFTKIGEQYGPFDIAFLEDGAYNTNWTQIHMMPEESVQASLDLKAKTFFPIHWGKFDLSFHPWTEPVERTLKSAKDKNVQVALPYIGEKFTLQDVPQRTWWREVE